MGTSEHAAWVAKAAAANVDTIQSGNAPKVVADQDYAELFNSMNLGGASRRAFMDDWAAALSGTTAPTTAAGPTQGAPPTRAPPAAAPTAVPPRTGPPTPLQRDNAVGRRVLVPSALYPQYNCSEQSGRGWESLVLSATSVTAVVRFLYARTADGRPYEDERLPLDRLEPL